jgi:hypothetical protein
LEGRSKGTRIHLLEGAYFPEACVQTGTTPPALRKAIEDHAEAVEDAGGVRSPRIRTSFRSPVASADLMAAFLGFPPIGRRLKKIGDADDDRGGKGGTAED